MTKGPGVVQVIVDPQRQREHLRRAEKTKMVEEHKTKQSGAKKKQNPLIFR